MNFVKHLGGGGANYKSLRTSDVEEPALVAIVMHRKVKLEMYFVPFHLTEITCLTHQHSVEPSSIDICWEGK
jgi:hypothetical protein